VSFFIGVFPILTAILIDPAGVKGFMFVIPWLLMVVTVGVLLSIWSPDYVWKVLLWLILFQEISLMILANFFGGDVTTALNLSKDLFALSVLSVLLLKPNLRIRVTFIDTLAVAFIGLNVFSFLFSLGKTPLFALGTAFKQNIMPYCLFLIGRLLPMPFEAQPKLVRLLINAGFFVAVFGLLERFLLGDRFWIWLGIYELAKNEGVFGLFNLLQGYGATRAPTIFYFMGDPSLRRLASIFGQPPLTSYFLALPLIILLFVSPLYAYGKVKTKVLIATIGATLVLTVGRGGEIIGGIGVMMLFLKRNKLLFAITGMIFLVMFSLSSDLRYMFSFEAIRFRHLKGLLNGLAVALETPFGHGVGSGGNYANWYGLQSQGGVVQESYVGSLGYQLGIVGLGMYALFRLLLFYRLYFFKTEARLPLFYSQFSQAIGVATLGAFVASFLAEAAVGFLSTGLYMLCAGMALRNILLQTSGKRNEHWKLAKVKH